MTGDRNRQPAGSTEGGQFTETARAESTATLAGEPDGIELARTALVKALADATHEEPENVVVDLPLGTTRQGWRPADLSVDMGDSWDTKVRLSGWFTPAGEVHDLAIFAEYNQTQERRSETGYDTTSVGIHGFEGPISGAVADVMQLARYQRGLEAQFNGP